MVATSLFATSLVAAPITDQLVQKAVAPPEPTSTPTETPAPTKTVTPNPTPPSTNSQAAASSSATQSTYTVSGYILDSNGNGIAGAQIIFCVPDIIPAVFSDSSGYYQASAPTGTYHVYVWPPFNSSYMSYEQKELVVSQNVAKNATLNAGYKLSGYITDSAETPINGAVVALNDYFNGYYSTVTGYYYVVAPAGTYTLNAHPKTGANFATYNESNVILNGNIDKNITITNQARYKLSGYVKDANGSGVSGAEIIFNVPNIIPAVFTNNAGYYEVYAPAGTYCLDIWPPFDSNYLSYEQQGFTIAGTNTKNFTLTQGCKVSGYIVDSNGNPVFGALAMLDNHLSGWYSKATGYYFVTAPSGTYTLTVQPRTGPNFATYTLNNFIVNGNLAQNITVVS